MKDLVVTAQEVLLDHLDKILSLTVDEALQVALQHTNEYGELDNDIYEKILSKLNELEQDAFTMGLATNEITVVDKAEKKEQEMKEDPSEQMPVPEGEGVPVEMSIEVEGPPLTLDEMQEAVIEEEDRIGSVSHEFYIALVTLTDLPTARRFNKWLVKTSLNLSPKPVQKTIVTKDYLRKLRKKLRENKQI